MPIDFHEPTKTLFNLQVSITTKFEDQWSRTPYLVTLRRLIGGPRFEKMKVALAHTNLPHQMPSTLGACLSLFQL